MANERPQVLRGMRDFLPEQMIGRQYVISVIRRVFESFGFEPLDTPALEYAEVLMGKYGPEADKLIYNFEDRGGRQVGLRYDLTVPLARVIASHPDLARPFKRYQVGTVWRAEKPNKGRYREFTQCDVDIVGAAPPAPDAEVVAVFYHVYQALGLTDVVIRLNHRAILGATARAAGISDDRRVDAFRSIDKLDKLTPEAVLEEMTAAGIDPQAAARLVEITNIRFGPGEIDSVRDHVHGDAAGESAVDEMAGMMTLLEASGVPPQNFVLDFSLARGLDYYTGAILEAFLPELRSSVGGGGRYDNLIGMFGAQPVPTVGASVGLDRIIDILNERQMLPPTRSVTQVLVTVFNSELRAESLALAAELRQTGLNVETFILDRPLGKQFAYASQKGIPYAVVIGPDELASQAVALRDMNSREQVTLPRSEVVSRLRGSA